ncbi:hypothetical protein HDU98_010340 [Podochytrium sp. JEL0797]|nr:hypothetical protein HDU98_010340 [Podochytrium sp. JEL0797]
MFDPIFNTSKAVNPSRHPSDPSISSIPGYRELYATNFYICYPIYVMALLVNGYIVGILVHKRSSLLVDRISCLMFSLVAVSFSWSFATVLLGIQDFVGSVPPLIINNVYAIVTSFVMVFQTFGNLALAMERLFLVSGTCSKTCFKFFAALGVWVLTAQTAVLIIFYRAPSLEGILPGDNSPDTAFESDAWFWLLIGGYWVLMIANVWIYVCTFNISKRYLRENVGAVICLIENDTARMESAVVTSADFLHAKDASPQMACDQIEFTRAKATRNILLNSVVMIVCLGVCQAPIVLYFMQLKVVEWSQIGYGGVDYVMWNCIGRVAAVMDSLHSMQAGTHPHSTPGTRFSCVVAHVREMVSVGSGLVLLRRSFGYRIAQAKDMVTVANSIKTLLVKEKGVYTRLVDIFSEFSKER